MISLVIASPSSVELGHGEPIEVHQAGRIIDDQPHGNPSAWIDDLNIRILLGARAGLLCTYAGPLHGEHGRR